MSGNRNQQHDSGQQGGGPSEADLSQAGGSSGGGGYGSSQNVVNHQGQGETQSGLAGGDTGHAHGQTRGTRFDEEQGGGRGVEDLDQEETEGAGPAEFAVDQALHQDRAEEDLPPLPFLPPLPRGRGLG